MPEQSYMTKLGDELSALLVKVQASDGGEIVEKAVEHIKGIVRSSYKAGCRVGRREANDDSV